MPNHHSRWPRRFHWLGFYAISICIGVAFHLLVNSYPAPGFESDPWNNWSAGAIAGLAAGIYTSMNYVPTSVGDFAVRGIATYYIGVVAWWLGLALVLSLNSLVTPSMTMRFDVVDTFKTLVLVLLVCTLPLSIVLLPLTIISRVCLAAYLVGFRKALGG